MSIPRRLAERLNIGPGDEIEWTVAGDALRISRPAGGGPLSTDEKLALFDAATRRQAVRNRQPQAGGAKKGRAWTREELYERGRSR